MYRKLAIKLLIEIEGIQKQLQTWKKIPGNLIKEENRLYQKLRTLIRQKNKEILEQLKKLDRIPSSDMELKALLLPLAEAKEEYNNIVMENTQEAIRAGMTRTINELKRQGLGKSVQANMRFYLNGSLKAASITGIDFDEFSHDISQRLKEQTFIASEQTIDRMTGDVMNNLRESYEAGYGIDKAAGNLNSVFDNMQGYELERVARTEINGAQNRGAEATELQLGIQYDMWRTAGDERVRGTVPEDTADHVYMDGQISRVGEAFSNGLTRPGDRSGRIAEWINCRCTLIPYLMPEGFVAPDMPYFYESNLIKIDIQPQPQPKEITPEPAKPKEQVIVKPLETSEAKYYATDNQDAESYIKFRLDFKEASYGDIKTEYANEINNTLVEYKNKYPKLAYKKLKYYDMGDPQRGGIMGSSSTYNVVTKEVEATLHINSKFFEKYPTSYDFKKKIMSGNKTGFTTAKDINDLVIHEAGHNLVYANSGCNSNSMLMDYRSILQETKGFAGMSEYAKRNLSEGLAEAFVSYNRGEKLPVDVLKQLKKYIGVK